MERNLLNQQVLENSRQVLEESRHSNSLLLGIQRQLGEKVGQADLREHEALDEVRFKALHTNLERLGRKVFYLVGSTTILGGIAGGIVTWALR